MPWARIRRSAIWLVPLVLAASAIYGVYIAVAGGTDDPPPLEDLLAECRSLEEQEAYAEGLRTVITALEDYPDNT